MVPTALLQRRLPDMAAQRYVKYHTVGTYGTYRRYGTYRSTVLYVTLRHIGQPTL